MKLSAGFFTLLFILNLMPAQTAQVTNVMAAQRTDGSKIVDITYDLSEDITFTYFTVSVEVSFDGGFTYQPTNYVSGAVGNGITAGTGRQVEWNLGAEYGGTYSDQTRVNVIATGRFFDVPFEFVVVPAGNYTFGPGNEIRNIAYDFELMKYEATNADYAAFLIHALESDWVWINGDWITGFYSGDEHIGPGDRELIHLPTSRISWNGVTFVVEEGTGHHPVVGVTWFGAYKFAEYYALRVPTEEEWEKGARGNTGYTYPWGNAIDGTWANYQSSGDPYDNGTTPAGFYNGGLNEGFQTSDSPSPYGAYDMAGNVVEWTATWGHNNTDRRIIRGGSWEWGTNECQTYWWSDGWGPWDQTGTLGFRCVRTISATRANFLLNKLRTSGKGSSKK